MKITEKYLSLLEENLSEKRIEHSKSVEKKIIELAEYFKYENIEQAKTAGILHDLTKEKTNEWQQAILKKNNIEVANVEKIWHAYTCPIYLKELGICLDEEIFEAIKNHTEGVANADALSMLLYIADLTEEHRKFPGITELRQYKGKTLEEYYAYCLITTTEACIIERGNEYQPTKKQQLALRYYKNLGN